MTKAQRAALALVLLLTAALVVAPWRGHVDDVDAQVYEVVARNMVADGAWLDLRYLPDVWPRFREHLPFSFWPAAAAIRLFGEGSVNVLYALFTLATVGLVGVVAARLGGGWAGVIAALVVGTCESVWQYGGRFLLEPPLLLFATAAAGAALTDRPRWRAAGALGALAVLVKGPFGLVPFGSIILARALVERSWRLLAAGIGVGMLATAPAALFLLLDRLVGSGTWWTGYLQDRVLGWASGARSEGLRLWWFPLAVIAGRFWPGLPLVGYGVWRALRDRGLRTLALSSGLAAILLCAPQKKWGNHTYVIFPLLAILAGVAAGPLLERLSSARFERRVVGSLMATAAAAWILSLAGFGKLVLQPPCVVSTEFADQLALVPRGSPIWVVSPMTEWLLTGQLAAERHMVPLRASAVPDPSGPTVALAREEMLVQVPWHEVARARGWALLRR